MTTDATPHGLVSSDGLGPLVACPFCGKEDGYTLAEGDTYCWWLVQCKACGAGVAECHSDRRTQAGTELPETWMAAHEAWNEAGKHAHELRLALRALAADAERYRLIRRADVEVDGCSLIYAEEALDAAIDAARGVGPVCTYPDCRCPFDAPEDPAWCAKGLPQAPRNVQG